MSLHCPSCFSKSAQVLRSYIAPYNQTEYTLHHCNQCNLQFWTPLEIIPEFYEASEHSSYERRHEGESTILERHLAFLDRARAQKWKGRLLDLGCADGSFIQAAKDSGFDVWGIDFDRLSIEAAKRRGLEKVYALTVKEFGEKFPDLKFDFITAFEVLEHQDQPNDFIRSAQALLKSGGVLAGSVPNRERPLAEQTRELSAGDFPPHHFLWFSKPVLQNYLYSRGFADVQVLPIHLKLSESAAYFEHNLIRGKTRSIKGRIAAPTESKKANSPAQLIKPILRFGRTTAMAPLSIATRLAQRGVGLYFEAQLASSAQE